jgi:hypothetical protein
MMEAVVVVKGNTSEKEIQLIGDVIVKAKNSHDRVKNDDSDEQM